MGSTKGLLYALGAVGISTTAYVFSRPKSSPTSTIKLHGAENCKYILDNSHSHTYTLPDGRELGYADYGDPKGKPILYQHGIPGSRIEATRYHDLGKELGLRIISIDRPGYGWSAPFSRYKGRTVKSWAEDINALAEHLQLNEYAVLVRLFPFCNVLIFLYFVYAPGYNLRDRVSPVAVPTRCPLPMVYPRIS